jgi:Ca2+-dependent lipid-binding protein
VIKNTLEPSWAEKEMSLGALANGDRQRSLRFTVWDWNASGKPDLIGAFETSVERLEAGQLTHQVSCFFIKEEALFLSGQLFCLTPPPSPPPPPLHH